MPTLLLVGMMLLTLLPLGGGLFAIARQTRRRIAMQQHLLRQWSVKIPHRAAFPVRAAGEKRFRKTIKLFPWDQSGVLFVTDAGMTLVLVDGAGRGKVRTIRREQGVLSWVGPCVWPNGGWHWFSVPTADGVLYLTSESGLTILGSEKGTRQIFNVLTGVEAPAPAAPVVPPSSFALEKNPLSLVVLLGFFALVAYAFVDTFMLRHEEYASFPYGWLIPVAALVAGGTGFFALSRFRVPRAEAIVLAGLLALAVALSVHPGLLRLNQWTAVEEPEFCLYRPVYAKNRLEPEDPDKPVIIYYMKETRAYWKQRSQGQPLRIALRKGGLGAYLVDLNPVYDDIEAFYRRQNR